MLKLTYRDLHNILREDYDRFKVISHGIPYGNGENPNDYIEDDGRQYRCVEFQDTETGENYYFQYIWHPEFSAEFPSDFMVAPEGIEWVEVSVIDPPKPVKEPEVVLSPEQVADKELWQTYLNTDGKRPFTTMKDAGLTKGDVDDICEFLSKPFSMLQLRAKIIPVCIEKKIEERSFWHFIQKKASGYKKRKKS